MERTPAVVAMTRLREELRIMNGGSGTSDIEGKAAREAVSECGQRANFKQATFVSAAVVHLVFVRHMTRSLLSIFLLVGITAFGADRDGRVGITVGGDMRVVIEVAPESPAARAGVRVGDRIVAVDGHSTAKLQKSELIRRLSGPPESEIELQLQRSGRDKVFRLRLRRVAAPSQIAPGFDAHQVRSDVKRPNQAMAAKRQAADQGKL